MRTAMASHRRAGALLACAFACVMLGTTLPTALYPSYQARFGFGGATVTAVYAIFAAGILGALLLVGPASDVIGRKRVLLPGLALAALSSALFLAAAAMDDGGLALLLTARLLSGMSAGIFTGTASATLTDLAGGDRAVQAGLVGAVATLGGAGLGPLLAGLVAQWGPAPLTTVFAVHLGLLALAAVAVAAIPETVRRTPGGFSPLWPRVAPPARAAFASATLAAFAGFAVSGLFVAVTPALLAELGHHDPALTGGIVSAMFAAGAAATIASARVRTDRALLAGTALLVVALAVLLIALGERSTGWLIAAAATAGASQGIGFRAALATVAAATPVPDRGRATSAFFAVAYVGGVSVPVLGVGIAGEQLGLIPAGEAFVAVIASLAIGALLRLGPEVSAQRLAATRSRQIAPAP